MSGVASRKVDVDEKAVLRTLVDNTYQETGDLHGISRGKVYSIALAHNARKNEERIAERKAERLNRQREMLEEMMESTQKADVMDYLESLPPACTDLVVTSIPYGLGVKYGGHRDSDTMAFVKYVGWMTMIISEN